MGALLFVFMVVMMIVTAVDVITGPLPKEKKILWGVLIFVGPVVGIVLYYLIGKTGQPAA